METELQHLARVQHLRGVVGGGIGVSDQGEKRFAAWLAHLP